MNAAPVARVPSGTTGHNTLNVRSVDIYFLKSPGTPGSDGRGIEGLDYRVMVGSEETQHGRTQSDGKVTVRAAPGQVPVLEVLGTRYEVTIATDELHPLNEIRGVQQRLEKLGYHRGSLHGDNRRADTYINPDQETERDMLDFQADHGLLADARFGPDSQNALQRAMRTAGRGGG